METLGIMLDCSRNAVMKPEKVKDFAKLISDMGYNMLQLYTEDTYEIDGEPFFGYMRGSYSHEEIRDIDAYCTSVGVELVPCIQVLAHLNQLKQWVPYGKLFDCNDILMVGDEKVYELIDKMFHTLEICFTSRRVNIGMDEAHFLGRGRYQDEHGYRNRVEILTEHLARVKEIADKHGFRIMMWSDMFIRLHNGGEYYGENVRIPQETIWQVPEGVELIYWDYYSKEKSHYDHMLTTHADFRNPIGFAGGLQTWTGYAPNLQFALETTEAAMRSIEEHPVNTIFFTLWGDNGKDCSYYSALPVMFAAAQMARGNFNRSDIKKRFEEKYGYSFDEFMNLELPNITKEEPSHFHNPCKYLLYNDPFIGIYDSTVRSDLSQRYANAAIKLKESINGRAYDYLFDMERKLLDVLARKCDLGIRLRRAYQTGDRDELKCIVEQEFPIIRQDMKRFFEAFRVLWMHENKPFGLEVQEQRFGGLLYRMEACEARLKSYLMGEQNVIEELEEICLVKYEGYEGEAVAQNNWSAIVTTSVMV
ncbi:MAG: beta-N-acetylhexosaminidase [Tyzzerella sp.]|nr:beta-N-acetylhexosaminidase [Tyzzerella sp.]